MADLLYSRASLRGVRKTESQEPRVREFMNHRSGDGGRRSVLIAEESDVEETRVEVGAPRGRRGMEASDNDASREMNEASGLRWRSLRQQRESGSELRTRGRGGFAPSSERDGDDGAVLPHRGLNRLLK